MTTVLPDTSTDMIVDVLADDQKLKTEEKRWNYGDTDSDDHAELDEDVSDDDNESESEDNNYNESSSRSHSSEPPKRNPNLHTFNSGSNMNSNTVSSRQIKLRKMELFSKLVELKKLRGIKLTQDYSFNESNVEDLEDEYQFQANIKSKSDMVGWFGNALILGAQGMEVMSDSYNPFDFTLKGLSNNISGDMNQYYEVLGELIDKYHVSGKPVAPELKLTGMILMACIGTATGGAINSMLNGGNDDKDDDDIEKLREEAKKNSKKDHYLDKENKKTEQLRKYEEHERELKKHKNVLEKNNFKLTTERSDNNDDEDERLSNADINRIRRQKKIEEERAFNNLREIAKEEFINKRRNEMEDILNESHPDFDEDDESSNKSSDNESQGSRMSVNSDVESIMSETTNKSNRLNIKKLMSNDDISFGSDTNKKRGRKKKKVDYNSISAASKKKGRKTKVVLN
jgi:hypothetical protein